MCMALKMQDVYFHFRQPYIASLYAYTIQQQVVLLILLLFTPNTLCDNPPSSLNQKLSFKRAFSNFSSRGHFKFQ